jgi:anti-sigma regulatory factor (Ser/Thr protein kinase)
VTDRDRTSVDDTRTGATDATRRRGSAVRRFRRARWRPRDGTDPGAARRARDWARRTLPQILSGRSRPDLGDDLDVVLSELVNNAIRHGGGVEEVRLRAAGTAVHLSVSDHQHRVPRVHPITDPRLENGRGMFLVQTLARRWGVRRNRTRRGKVVWLELALSGRP